MKCPIDLQYCKPQQSFVKEWTHSTRTYAQHQDYDSERSFLFAESHQSGEAGTYACLSSVLLEFIILGHLLGRGFHF